MGKVLINSQVIFESDDDSQIHVLHNVLRRKLGEDEVFEITVCSGLEAEKWNSYFVARGTSMSIEYSDLLSYGAAQNLGESQEVLDMLAARGTILVSPEVDVEIFQVAVAEFQN